VLPGGCVFGNDQHPGGVLVKPVNDSGSELSFTPPKFREVIKKGIDQCPGIMARRRVYDQSGGFVYNDKVGIFMDDIEGNRLRFGPNRFERRNMTAD
jgi:hypothetical protein